jgi:hypothetical protein
MAATFQPLASLKDFDRSPNSAALHNAWHKKMDDTVKQSAASFPAFYHPLHPPVATPPLTKAPVWTGLPRTIKRLRPGPIATAAGLVDSAVPMGQTDPLFGRLFTTPFHDTTGRVFAGPAYRPQDEYLEWVTQRDTDGTVNEIIFTCEGPEYWDTIAQDDTLLLTMYQELLQDATITLADLKFPKTVTWQNPNSRGGPDTFPAGSYNRYNKWNIRGVVHLTQPANSLGAEITLAKFATLLYGNPTPVTTDPDLVCCAEYGDPNRMSDPTIGSGVNTFVRSGLRVTLRNPIGLYIKGIDLNAFSLPDGTPFTQVQECFQPSRPAPADVTDMIVRARFRVPDGITFGGKQLRVGDLLVNSEKIQFGGQVADVVNMTLFAQTLPGAPAQARQRCQGRPCHDPRLPDFVVLIDFNRQCPSTGMSPLVAHLAPPATDALANDVIESADAPAAPAIDYDALPLRRTRNGS